MAQLFQADEAGARFSDCRKWRYSLWRVWDAKRDPLVFIGMNPSIADEVILDPTLRLMVKRAEMYGCGGLWVANVFSWVETDSRKLPRLLTEGVDIVGPENDATIVEVARRGKLVVAGWGKPGNLNGRGDRVAAMLREAGVTPLAFKRNKDGTPTHPLYISLDVAPEIPL